ncbi:COMM domain-containing protein 7 [Capsaspora owczarzaki ATCC 30864]|uniref:COMM domain-containing protein 7 n=1 Tax=Capsaspora owczarzaki (strain ATCC 30864) TaxID=595528 RepID=UPI0001FE2F6F|nr:COMM domain-containing protein 7 [Capsaspora owczarzaki ATCC 30864]|eukprot:XP_004346286.1 COMM domain-containing protein 7 [Capsaspora owczarzaki ATCC 30864]
MALHYTKDAPDPQLRAHFTALAALEKEPFAQLVTIVFGFLSQPQSGLLLDQLQEFATTHGTDVQVLRDIVRSLLLFLKAATRLSLTPIHVKEDLNQLGLEEPKARFVATQWKNNSVAVTKTMVGQTLMVNQLIDMEWRFGITAGSSEIRSIGSTFLQLKLVLNRGNGPEDTFIELTLPQFYTFLHEMEKAKTSLDHMT